LGDDLERPLSFGGGGVLVFGALHLVFELVRAGLGQSRTGRGKRFFETEIGDDFGGDFFGGGRRRWRRRRGLLGFGFRAASTNEHGHWENEERDRESHRICHGTAFAGWCVVNEAS